MKYSIQIILFTQLCLAADPESLQKQVALTRNKLLNIELKQEQLLSDLIQINKKIKMQTIKLGYTEKEIQIINAEIDRQKAGIKTASKLLVESKKRLTTKIKAISKIKSGNLLQIALVHNSLSDIEKSVKMLGIIASFDVQYINDYYEKKVSLNRDLKDLDSRYLALKQKQDFLAKQKLNLEKDSSSRLLWLNKVKQSKLFTEAQIEKMKINQSKQSGLTDLGVFDIFSKESILKNRGNLKPPLDGEILQNFGIKSADQSIIVNHSGVFFAANLSSNVKALFNAEVIYIGKLQGLGQIIILDHGDNYYSVYGNLSGVIVKNKQIVKTGQLIAQADYSPLYDERGLYFEIRHYSQSLNPSDWIRSFHETN